jgi:hypothetical protein
MPKSRNRPKVRRAKAKARTFQADGFKVTVRGYHGIYVAFVEESSLRPAYAAAPDQAAAAMIAKFRRHRELEKEIGPARGLVGRGTIADPLRAASFKEVRDAHGSTGSGVDGVRDGDRLGDEQVPGLGAGDLALPDRTAAAASAGALSR